MKVIKKDLSNFIVLFPAFLLVFFSDISFVVLHGMFCAVSIYLVVFVLVKFIVKLLYDMGTVQK